MKKTAAGTQPADEVNGKRYLDWKLADPAGGDLEAIRPIREEIEALVRALIQEIAPA
jgi:arsenate reductase